VGGSGSLEPQMLDMADQMPILRYPRLPNAPRRRLRSHRPLGLAWTESLSEERGKLLYQANQVRSGREQPKSGRPMLLVNGVELDARKTRFVDVIEDRASSQFFIGKETSSHFATLRILQALQTSSTLGSEQILHKCISIRSAFL